jgi:c(7)-type cytochrome triheme protein
MGDRLRASRTWRLVVVAVLVVVLLSIAFFLSQPGTQAQGATQQPIAFNHAVMVKQGITCLFCHADATRSPVAGMPSVQKCMGCHTVIDTDNPEIVKLAAYWQRQEPIPWVRVNQLPRYVYFSHQAHVVAASLNCETCHGDVSLMTVDQPVVQMNMGWCLSCHEKQANAPQLMECETCHQ